MITDSVNRVKGEFLKEKATSSGSILKSPKKGVDFKDPKVNRHGSVNNHSNW